ncbi:MAG: hypothetical protein CMO80_04490 [Verrucomicrobiales bacterium]|nr:hypothetical protein [Verrucomicrobiales bacterium]
MIHDRNGRFSRVNPLTSEADLREYGQVGPESFWRLRGNRCLDVALAFALFLFAFPISSVPPQVTSHPQSLTAPVGGTVEFTVAFNGTPQLFILWFHNGTLLASETSSTLRIENLIPAHAGDYHAVIVNSEGSATTTTARLDVIAAAQLGTPTKVQPDRFQIIFNLPGQTALSASDAARFRVEASTDMQNWNLLPADLTESAGALMLEDQVESTSKAKFYRVTEFNVQNVPNMLDGITLDWRLQYFGRSFLDNPLALGAADPDGDDVSNFVEFQLGTDPRSSADAPRFPVEIRTYSGNGVQSGVDGPLSQAGFFHPAGMDFDVFGNLLIAEGHLTSATTVGNLAHRVRTISPGGIVSTWVGGNDPGYVDAQGDNARFRGPSGLVVNSQGITFIADRLNHRIRRIDQQGNVSTVASAGRLLQTPIEVIADAADNLYVSEYDGAKVARIAPDGTISTFAGTGIRGTGSGFRTQTRLNKPGGLGIGPDGTMYIGDWGAAAVRTVDPSGHLSTLIGDLPFLEGMGIDSHANIYVTLPLNGGELRKYSRDGTLIWSLTGGGQVVDGPIGVGKFKRLSKPFILPNGNILVGDEGALREIVMAPIEVIDLGGASEQFSTSTTVSMSTTITGAEIRFTVDGTEPTASSSLYTGSFQVASTLDVKARLFSNGLPVSRMQTKNLIRTP